MPRQKQMHIPLIFISVKFFKGRVDRFSQYLIQEKYSFIKNALMLLVCAWRTDKIPINIFLTLTHPVWRHNIYLYKINIILDAC